MDHKIIENKAQCLKCGDVIESLHRHDFVTCQCRAISVDGGKDYLKRSVGSKGYEDTSIEKEDLNDTDSK